MWLSFPGLTAMRSPIESVLLLWRYYEARDWRAARRLICDDATLHWHASGERFDGADLIIRVNAEYPEGWHIEVEQVATLQDGRVLSVCRVEHGDDTFLATSLFSFMPDGRISEIEEWYATREAPPVWRQQAGWPGYRMEPMRRTPARAA